MKRRKHVGVGVNGGDLEEEPEDEVGERSIRLRWRGWG